MKKFLTSFAIAAICSLSANAQDAAAPTADTASTVAQPAHANAKMRAQAMQKRSQMDDPHRTYPVDFKSKSGNVQMANQENPAHGEKWKNASPEEKKKMAEHHEKMANMTPEEREKMMKEKGERKEARHEKYENASPEEKARMDHRHEMMENLSPEKKEAAKQEMKRHHQEMKKITGDNMAPAAQ